jgi:hypothetical protein
VCVGFAGVDLATGEFEEVAVAFVGRALADEEGVGAADDGGDDADRGRGHCGERAARCFVVPGLRPSTVDSIASFLPIDCRIAALLSAGRLSAYGESAIPHEWRCGTSRLYEPAAMI